MQILGGGRSFKDTQGVLGKEKGSGIDRCTMLWCRKFEFENILEEKIWCSLIREFGGTFDRFQGERLDSATIWDICSWIMFGNV